MIDFVYIEQHGTEAIYYELPVSRGKQIEIDFGKQVGYSATYINKGFSPELAREVIIIGCSKLEELESACEGYLNARLSKEQKKELNVDTTKRGWLEQFKLQTHSNVGGNK